MACKGQLHDYSSLLQPVPGQKIVVTGCAGSTLNDGKPLDRGQRWRPAVSLLMHDVVEVEALVPLHSRPFGKLVRWLSQQAAQNALHTRPVPRQVNISDPWDFARGYGALYDFVQAYPFDPHARLYAAYHHRHTCGIHVLVFADCSTGFARLSDSKRPLSNQTAHEKTPGTSLNNTSHPDKTAANKTAAGRYWIFALDLFK